MPVATREDEEVQEGQWPHISRVPKASMGLLRLSGERCPPCQGTVSPSIQKALAKPKSKLSRPHMRTSEQAYPDRNTSKCPMYGG